MEKERIGRGKGTQSIIRTGEWKWSGIEREQEKEYGKNREKIRKSKLTGASLETWKGTGK